MIDLMEHAQHAALPLAIRTNLSVALETITDYMFGEGCSHCQSGSALSNRETGLVQYANAL